MFRKLSHEFPSVLACCPWCVERVCELGAHGTCLLKRGRNRHFSGMDNQTRQMRIWPARFHALPPLKKLIYFLSPHIFNQFPAIICFQKNRWKSFKLPKMNTNHPQLSNWRGHNSVNTWNYKKLGVPLCSQIPTLTGYSIKKPCCEIFCECPFTGSSPNTC